jgi:hypothetical protein
VKPAPSNTINVQLRRKRRSVTKIVYHGRCKRRARRGRAKNPVRVAFFRTFDLNLNLAFGSAPIKQYKDELCLRISGVAWAMIPANTYLTLYIFHIILQYNKNRFRTYSLDQHHAEIPMWVRDEDGDRVDAMLTFR